MRIVFSDTLLDKSISFSGGGEGEDERGGWWCGGLIKPFHLQGGDEGGVVFRGATAAQIKLCSKKANGIHMSPGDLTPTPAAHTFCRFSGGNELSFQVPAADCKMRLNVF